MCIHSNRNDEQWIVTSIYLRVCFSQLIFNSNKNLLESVGNLPERALKALAIPILTALDDIHSKLNAAHGVMSPS